MKRITTLFSTMLLVCALSSAQDVRVLENPCVLTPDVEKQSYGFSAVFSNDTLFVSGASTNVESIVDSYVITAGGVKKIGTIKEGGVKKRSFFGAKLFASGGRLGVLASANKYFYIYDKTAEGVSAQPVDSVERKVASMFVDMVDNYFITSEKCTLNVYDIAGSEHKNVFARSTSVDAPCVMEDKTLCYIDKEVANGVVVDSVLRIVEDPETAFSEGAVNASMSVVKLSGYGGFSSFTTIGLDIKNGKIAVGLSTGCNKVLIIEKLSSGWAVTGVIEKPEDVEGSWGYSLSFADENSIAIGSNRKGDGYVYACADSKWSPLIRLKSDIESGYVVTYNGDYFVTTNNTYKGTTGDLTNCGAALVFDVKGDWTPISDIKVEREQGDGVEVDLYGRRVGEGYKGLVIKDGRLILKK